MKTFREIVIGQETNEGMIGNAIKKMQKWLINNIKPIKQKYINYSSAYANQRIIIERPDTKIRMLVAENGFVYMDAYDKKGKNFFLMSDDAVMADYQDMIQGESPIRLVCAKMEEFEYGGMIPYYIYRIYEA